MLEVGERLCIMSNKSQKKSNLFEDEAKRRNVSVEQVKKDYKSLATLVMLRIENSDNQKLKGLWNETFPDRLIPTAEDFAREWLLFKIFNPDGLKDENGEKITLERVLKGDI